MNQQVQQMYKTLYWGQIFNLKTSWEIKWVAVRSLFCMRKWSKE